jgi:tetratricopeptide (TPR) repeat protein
MPDSKLTMKQLIARGKSAWERDEYAVALEDFRTVLADHPEFPDIQNRAGLCMAMLGETEGALKAFTRAVEQNPAYAEAHLNRAIVLNELGRYDEAHAAFNRAGDLDRKRGETFPADIGNRIAIGHARLGDLYLEMNQADRAASEFQQALEIRPHFADIRSKLAQAYIMMGMLDSALEELQEIIRVKPNFTAARIRLGTVHLRMGRREQAVEEWLMCAEQDPEDRRIRAYLASAGHVVAQAATGAAVNADAADRDEDGVGSRIDEMSREER